MARRKARKTRRRTRAVRETRKPKEEMRNIVGFVLTFFAGIFTTIQGYQGIIGNAITGNVIGTPIGSGLGGLGVIFGILILVGAFLMIITETMRFGGILVIILGILSAIVTQGASIIPSSIAVFGGLLAMTAG